MNDNNSMVDSKIISAMIEVCLVDTVVRFSKANTPGNLGYECRAVGYLFCKKANNNKKCESQVVMVRDPQQPIPAGKQQVRVWG